MFLQKSLLIQKLDTSSSFLLILLLLPNDFWNFLHFSTVNFPNNQVLSFIANNSLGFVLYNLRLFNCVSAISHHLIEIMRWLNMLSWQCFHVRLHQIRAFGSNAHGLCSCWLWNCCLIGIETEVRWHSIRAWTRDVTLCLVMKLDLSMALVKTERF